MTPSYSNYNVTIRILCNIYFNLLTKTFNISSPFDKRYFEIITTCQWIFSSLNCFYTYINWFTLGYVLVATSVMYWCHFLRSSVPYICNLVPTKGISSTNYVIIVYFIEQITYNSDFKGDLLFKPFSGKSRKTFKYEY
jgi:hypothetical protein